MTSKHNVILKPAAKAAVEEVPHRVPYACPGQTKGAGNMPGLKNAQRIAREHNGD